MHMCSVAITRDDIRQYVPISNDAVGDQLHDALYEILAEPETPEAVRMHLSMYAMLAANPGLLSFRRSPSSFVPLLIAVAARFAYNSCESQREREREERERERGRGREGEGEGQRERERGERATERARERDRERERERDRERERERERDA
jgi:hypothetical protein